MKHPVLPADEVRPLPFYLAMEEWIARNLPPDDYFFAWRVNPTVICGRNQDIEKEVNLEYCRKNGISVVRRRSGGGCVYADMNNWMFSYITPSSEVSSTFARYTSMVADMLNSLGLETSATGRNDILVNKKKIAGNAFYHMADRAIVHGTMLYEDGPNGDCLPTFRNITIENITAHGGDYGIFLEAFPEVPITGLTLRNIQIDGTCRTLHAMNWQDAHMENVTLNGKVFPRPGSVRILGVPTPGALVSASAVHCGDNEALDFQWEMAGENGVFSVCGTGNTCIIPAAAKTVRVTARDSLGHAESSAVYRVLPDAAVPGARLACRGMLPDNLVPRAEITRDCLAYMLMPLADLNARGKTPVDTDAMHARVAVANGFFPLNEEGCFEPYRAVTRREMATVCMQACGINYRNASSTMPVCNDVDMVGQNFGTNVARALYFGFMELEQDCFDPMRLCTVEDAITILTRVADFAGL